MVTRQVNYREVSIRFIVTEREAMRVTCGLRSGDGASVKETLPGFLRNVIASKIDAEEISVVVDADAAVDEANR